MLCCAVMGYKAPYTEVFLRLRLLNAIPRLYKQRQHGAIEAGTIVTGAHRESCSENFLKCCKDLKLYRENLAGGSEEYSPLIKGKDVTHCLEPHNIVKP